MKVSLFIFAPLAGQILEMHEIGLDAITISRRLTKYRIGCKFSPRPSDVKDIIEMHTRYDRKYRGKWHIATPETVWDETEAAYCRQDRSRRK